MLFNWKFVLYKAVVGTSDFLAVYENIAYSVEHFAGENYIVASELLFVESESPFVFPILFADKVSVLFIKTYKWIFDDFVVD